MKKARAVEEIDTKELFGVQGAGTSSTYSDDDVVYWYSFSNHYTKRAFTQP